MTAPHIRLMETCQACGSPRVGLILARCSDMCSVDLAGKHRHGYVPSDLGVGGGDDIQFRYCLDCGQLQGRFPLPPTSIERGE
jgi:hypothetical protein